MNCDLVIESFLMGHSFTSDVIDQNNILSQLNWLVKRIMQSQNWPYSMYIYSYEDIVCWNW